MTTVPLPVCTLADLAQVIRSKNAGPTPLTIGVFLRDTPPDSVFQVEAIALDGQAVHG